MHEDLSMHEHNELGKIYERELSSFIYWEKEENMLLDTFYVA